MCVLDDGEYCDVWDETEHTSRKDRKCDCCKGIIKKGERYVRHFHVFEGTACTESMCMPCAKDRKEFADAHEGNRYPPSYTLEMLNQCIGDNALYGQPEPPENRRWKRMIKRIRERGEKEEIDA